MCAVCDFGCIAMGSALLFIVRSRLLVYSAGSGATRVQVVLSGFSRRLFCFVQAKTLCGYGCLGYTRTCVSGCDVVCMGHDLNRLLYALFNHPRLLIQVARVQKAQFSYRLDGLVP